MSSKCFVNNFIPIMPELEKLNAFMDYLTGNYINSEKILQVAR